ncbi:MAG: GntR family transcriptional regulator [Candidatus Nanopelagicales bacterium]
MSAAAGFTRPPTAQEAVLAQVRRELVAGALRPGEQVRQEQLAERYGVSRVPLREALKILEGEGQVVYHPHRGYFVAELSVADLIEVYRLRELLEAEAIRAAVPRLTEGSLAGLRAAHAAVIRANRSREVAAITDANRRFHFALFELSGRPRLVRMLSQLWDSTDVYRTGYFGQPVNRRRVDAEHEQQLAALARRDTEAVVRLQAEHRDHSVTTVRAVIESGLL